MKIREQLSSSRYSRNFLSISSRYSRNFQSISSRYSLILKISLKINNLVIVIF